MKSIEGFDFTSYNMSATAAIGVVSAMGSLAEVVFDLFMFLLFPLRWLCGLEVFDYNGRSGGGQRPAELLLRYLTENHSYASSQQVTADGTVPLGLVVHLNSSQSYLAFVTLHEIKRNDLPVTVPRIRLFAGRGFTTDHKKGTWTADPKKNDDLECGTSSHFIEILKWQREYPYPGDRYAKQNTIQRHLYPKMHQTQAMEFIEGLVHDRDAKMRSGVICVSGGVGTGKSSIADLYARQINATLCDQYQPCIAFTLLRCLIDRVEPTYAQPLVVVLNEFDSMLLRLLRGEYQSMNSKVHLPDVYDRSSLNTFLDGLRTLPNVIFILTLNRGYQELFREVNALPNGDRDLSSMRYGRVQGFIRITSAAESEQDSLPEAWLSGLATSKDREAFLARKFLLLDGIQMIIDG